MKPNDLTKKDWIILRLLLVAIESNKSNSSEVIRTVLYMRKKYGMKVLGWAADQLRGVK